MTARCFPRFSAAEQRAYARQILHGLELRIDDEWLLASYAGGTFPDVASLPGGDASIVLRFEAKPFAINAGAHRLHFRNNSAGSADVYLANVLVPSDSRIAVTAQDHTTEQRALVVDFVKTDGLGNTTWWLGLGGVGLALVSWRRARQ